MLLGMFCALACTLPAGQVAIVNGQVRDGASGQVVGAYYDDTDPNEPADTAAAVATGEMTIAASYGHTDPRLPAGAIDAIEHYPVLDAGSSTTIPAERDYILQAFSWGDNVIDGQVWGRCTSTDSDAACATRYAAPTAAQMQMMWCQAIANHPRTVLWYFAGDQAAVQQILDLEQATCTPPPASHTPTTAPPTRPATPHHGASILTSWKGATR